MLLVSGGSRNLGMVVRAIACRGKKTLDQSQLIPPANGSIGDHYDKSILSLCCAAWGNSILKYPESWKMSLVRILTIL